MTALIARRRGLRTLVAVAGAWLAGRAIVDRLGLADVRGEVAFVTGGSRGLGLLLARELGRAGCRVAICARDADELQVAVRSLAGDGVEALAIPCDVGDRAAVEAAVREIESQLGSVDILVNNASIIEVGAVETLGIGDLEAAMQADLWGTVYPTLAVLPGMRRRGRGRIANVTSIGGRVSFPHLLPYSVAKFAATGFSEGLHAELAREGIRVTTIIPWFMRTGSYTRALFKPPRRAEFTWFALGAALPGISLSPERAAREIVAAIRRGDSERSIGLLAVAAWRLHGLFPGLTARVLGAVNRLLPRPPVAVGPGRPVPPAVVGEVPEGEIASPAFEAATTLGRQAADQLYQRTSEPGRDEPASAEPGG